MKQAVKARLDGFMLGVAGKGELERRGEPGDLWGQTVLAVWSEEEEKAGRVQRS